MGGKKKYLLTTLCLILSVSLAIPFCCHGTALKQMPASHGQQAGQKTHAVHPNRADCHCGHQLRRDIQMPNEVVIAGTYSLTAALPLVSIGLNPSVDDTRLIRSKFLSLLDYPVPPLHLLNSVFLN